MQDRDFVSLPYPTSGRDLQNRRKKFANTASGLGVRPPKRKFFETFLTSTKLHLVDQISSEGRTEGLLTFPQFGERTDYVAPYFRFGGQPPKTKIL